MAQRHGRLALLLPLGYLIPTVVMGYVDNWPILPYSLIWISGSVLAYRVLVTLIAPIWIVRSASDRAQKRAGTIVLLVALGIIVAAHAGYFFASLAAYGWNLGWTDYYYYFSPDLIILVGMALAITLYQSIALSQAVAVPQTVLTEITGA
jgi:cation transport ATPase